MKNINEQLNKLPKAKKKVSDSKSVSQASFKANALPSSNINPLLKAMVLEDTSKAKVFTANGALTNKSTGDKVLDFFSKAGAFRSQTEAVVVDAFKKALFENSDLAMKALFYIRDIRGGQGERKTFRTCLRWLASNYPNVVTANFENILFYGRTDDLFELVGTQCEKQMMTFINNKLHADLSSENPSLIAKWMPSTNASSLESRKMGLKFASFMSLSERNYRRILSFLRKKISLVEQAMCKKDWSSISYDKIPSRAGFLYRKAFARNDNERYAAFLDKAAKGEVKINTSGLYPYDIVRSVLSGDATSSVDVMWNNLPDFFEGSECSMIPLIDVSSSMLSGGASVPPMYSSIGLGLYVSERNNGPFKNWFITFEESPKLQTVNGSTVYEKINNIRKASWGGSTNLQAAFELILESAKARKVKQSDMPKKLIVFSDMEFNTACKSNKLTNLEVIKSKYKAAKYKMPEIIFWNLNAREDNSPAKMNEDGVMLVSGSSPSTIKFILGGKITNPYDEMVKILSSERYANVRF